MKLGICTCRALLYLYDPRERIVGKRRSETWQQRDNRMAEETIGQRLCKKGSGEGHKMGRWSAKGLSIEVHGKGVQKHGEPGQETSEM